MRPLQVAGQLEPAHHVGVHLGGEDLHPAAAACPWPWTSPRRRCAARSRVARRLGEGDADAGRQRDRPGPRPGTAPRPRRWPAARPGRRLPALPRRLRSGRRTRRRPSGRRCRGRHGRAQPPGRLREHAGRPRAWPTESLTAVKPSRSRKTTPAAVRAPESGSAASARRRRGALLEVGAVGQAGQAVVEGQVRHLPAQRHLVADVARRDQQLVGPAGMPVRRDRRLDVPPGAVGGPHPAREPARQPRLVERRGHGLPAAGPVLRVDQLVEPGAEQPVGRVPVLGHRRAGVADDPALLADDHDVAGEVGQLTEPAPRIPARPASRACRQRPRRASARPAQGPPRSPPRLGQARRAPGPAPRRRRPPPPGRPPRTRPPRQARPPPSRRGARRAARPATA